MRRAMRSVTRKLPELGLALHGKPAMYLDSILSEGLRPYRRREVYYCPLPPDKVARRPPTEVLERTIGSILHATSWAVEGDLGSSKDISGRLPVILILRGNEHNPFLGSYREEERHTRLIVHPSYPQQFGLRQYRSFGVHTTDHIPPEQIAAVVKLTPIEHKRIVRKVGNSHAAVTGEVQKLMVFKTLRKLRALTRKLGRKPSGQLSFRY